MRVNWLKDDKIKISEWLNRNYGIEPWLARLVERNIKSILKKNKVKEI